MIFINNDINVIFQFLFIYILRKTLKFTSVENLDLVPYVILMFFSLKNEQQTIIIVNHQINFMKKFDIDLSGCVYH